MLPESIGLGILLGFLSSELLGISAGGLVSPGYLAFFFEQPLRLASTFGLSLAVYLGLRALHRYIILFGKRRFMAAVLLGILGSRILDYFLLPVMPVSQDLRIIGYVIPGLIANDMLRQGVFRTIAGALTVAAIVRLVIMAFAF